MTDDELLAQVDAAFRVLDPVPSALFTSGRTALDHHLPHAVLAELTADQDPTTAGIRSHATRLLTFTAHPTPAAPPPAPENSANLSGAPNADPLDPPDTNTQHPSDTNAPDHAKTDPLDPPSANAQHPSDTDAPDDAQADPLVRAETDPLSRAEVDPLVRAEAPLVHAEADPLDPPGTNARHPNGADAPDHAEADPLDHAEADPLFRIGAEPPGRIGTNAANDIDAEPFERIGAARRGDETAFAGSGADGLTIEVEVSGDQSLEMFGRVMPAVRAAVLVRNPQGTRRTETDSDGHFAVDGIPAGPVSLVFDLGDGVSVATSWIRL